MNTNNQASKSASATRATPAKATSPNGKSMRGFAAMDPAEQRRIASEGGRASHESGRGHRFTSEEARAAGRKGGQASRTRTTPTNPGTSASAAR
jgi:general stress protein YciG